MLMEHKRLALGHHTEAGKDILLRKGRLEELSLTVLVPRYRSRLGNKQLLLQKKKFQTKKAEPQNGKRSTRTVHTSKIVIASIHTAWDKTKTKANKK